MISDRVFERGKLKGYMWEIVILELLKENEFLEILTVDDIRLRRQRNNFLEMRGRGAWHQIDCCCDYEQFIPFINPIRLLGEVKFHVNPVEKHWVRSFIGVVKDIQENYFISDDFSVSTERYTELGVFFSANGFNKEAERLAFAHNIKTISYKNIPILRLLKEQIIKLERKYFSAKNCLGRGNQNDFIRLFKDVLSGNDPAISELKRYSSLPNGFEDTVGLLRDGFKKIGSSFIANSSGGAMMHFVGEEAFPDELFVDVDRQICQVNYDFSETQNTSPDFYLVFSNDNKNRRFYFSPPVSLSQAVFFGAKEALDVKEKIFKTLHTARRLNGITRSLILELDKDWLEWARTQVE